MLWEIPRRGSPDSQGKQLSNSPHFGLYVCFSCIVDGKKEQQRASTSEPEVHRIESTHGPFRRWACTDARWPGLILISIPEHELYVSSSTEAIAQFPPCPGIATEPNFDRFGSKRKRTSAWMRLIRSGSLEANPSAHQLFGMHLPSAAITHTGHIEMNGSDCVISIIRAILT